MELPHQGDGQLPVLFAKDQDYLDRLTCDPSQIGFLDVLKINEDVIGPGHQGLVM